ncbi:MAG: hypothetical protein SFU98_00820 [Leptospiraceae bacterium]|nr:hypothetical protein [Leptospiraceae bacterium]
MFFTKKIIYLLIILSLACSKDKSDKESFLKKFDSKDVLGAWRIIPSQNETVLFLPTGEVELIKENYRSKMLGFTDGNGLRLKEKEDDPNSLGYFLFSEKNGNIWSGIFRDDLVRLVRVVEPKKSILE